ncbi:MAG: ferritin [Propionivibrio sp.]
MRNYDETVLRKRKINHGAARTDFVEALRMALYAEYEARAFYRRIVEAFAGKSPSATLLRSSDKRIGWLLAEARRHGVPSPQDTAFFATQLSPSWLDNCLRAANGESALAGLYGELIPHAGSRTLAMLYAKLQRHSLESQLPLLRQAIAAASEQERFHMARGVPPQEAYMKHGLVSTILEKVFSVLGTEHRAIGLFAPVLRNTHPAFITGLAIGGAVTTYVVKKKSQSKRKEG